MGQEGEGMNTTEWDQPPEYVARTRLRNDMTECDLLVLAGHCKNLSDKMNLVVI